MAGRPKREIRARPSSPLPPRAQRLVGRGWGWGEVRQIRCQFRKANSLRQIQCQFRKGELAETPPTPTPPHRCAEGGEQSEQAATNRKAPPMLLRHEHDLLLPSPRPPKPLGEGGWWGGVGGGGWFGRFGASFEKRIRSGRFSASFEKANSRRHPHPPDPSPPLRGGRGAEQASDGESNLIPLTLVLLGAASNPNPDLPQKAAIGGLF
jgi:hypothetical protein